MTDAQTADTPDPVAEALGPLRARIDAIDREVVALLNERAGCAAEIGHIKKAAGLPVYVPTREADVIRNVVEANDGPLPPVAVQRLFEAIIDETRSLEREMAGDASEGPGDSAP